MQTFCAVQFNETPVLCLVDADNIATPYNTTVNIKIDPKQILEVYGSEAEYRWAQRKFDDKYYEVIEQKLSDFELFLPPCFLAPNGNLIRVAYANHSYVAEVIMRTVYGIRKSGLTAIDCLYEKGYFELRTLSNRELMITPFGSWQGTFLGNKFLAIPNTAQLLTLKAICAKFNLECQLLDNNYGERVKSAHTQFKETN